MAKKSCDLCVTVNPWKTVDTFQIVFEGSSYDVAVCSRHLAVIQTLFAPVFDAKPSRRNVVKAAAPAPAKKTAAKKAAPAKQSSNGASAVSPAEVREWARGKGLEVPKRGRVGAALTDAYLAAHKK